MKCGAQPPRRVKPKPVSPAVSPRLASKRYAALSTWRRAERLFCVPRSLPEGTDFGLLSNAPLHKSRASYLNLHHPLRPFLKHSLVKQPPAHIALPIADDDCRATIQECLPLGQVRRTAQPAVVQVFFGHADAPHALLALGRLDHLEPAVALSTGRPSAGRADRVCRDRRASCGAPHSATLISIPWLPVSRSPWHRAAYRSAGHVDTPRPRIAAPCATARPRAPGY